MKSNIKHLYRRCFLFSVSIIVGLFAAYVICKQIVEVNYCIDVNNMMEVSKVMIGVWSTLLGFIITAESILVAFDGGTITGDFKKTGHYMTVIFQYTQTCIKLLSYIVAFICIIIIKKFLIVEMFIFIFCTVMTFIDVLISFIILILMLKMVNR